MMRRSALLCAAILPFVAFNVPTSGQQAAGPATAGQSSSPAAASPPTPVGELVGRYCVTCHNQKLAVNGVNAGLQLDRADARNVANSAAVWEKVIVKLRTQAMPPPGNRRPDGATYDAVATWLETELDRAAALNPNPGRSILRRLNRLEYTNAVRDLLAVDVDAERLLPIDEVKFGFDNIGSALSVTPVLLERYMSAAREISSLAVGETEVRPASETYPVDLFLLQEDRMSEDLPFGSRGGIAVRHHFPVDGEYSIKVVLQRNSRGYVRGLYEPHQLDFRLDGARVHLATIGGGDSMAIPGPPFAQAGTLGNEEAELYMLTDVDQHLEARFFAKAGSRIVGVSFLRHNLVPEGPLRPQMTEVDRVQYKGGEPAVDHIEVAGPFKVAGVGDTPSRQKVFVCRPTRADEESACAGRILTSLARRAYRRPLAEKDAQALLAVYQGARADGGDFDAGIRAGISRILVGPEFLFRVERDPATAAPGSIHRVTDLELASRISFFLWSSVPDDELLAAAERGTLKDPAVLAQQVRRMVRDPRSKSLVTNFASQWLYLRNLRSVKPDSGLFTEFDSSLRDAFRQETELFVESTLREDQSVLRMLDADYTFLNERLARHYGIPDVHGSHFRRVTLGPEFDARRGLLGQGSLLTVTSYANRTSVVLRGKWVLENLLNAPLPPPPANIPPLEQSGAPGKMPLRQLMERHRANPVCATCHSRMDPLGFALENFDAIGQWRTTDAATPIDSSGVLPDGTKIAGPAGLRQALLAKPEQFVGTVTERMLTYALGRGLEYYDVPAIRSIVKKAAQNDYRWSALILATVESMPFQMKKTEEP
jgi:hypothetical protein